MERRKFLGIVRGAVRHRRPRGAAGLGGSGAAALRPGAARRHPRRAAEGARARRRDQLRLPLSVRRHAVLPAQSRAGRSTAAATLRREDGTTYAWSGGVGPARAIVAFSAICAHKLAYPTRDVSFIRYQPQRSATSDAQVIHCCADHSVYDPASGRARAGGAGAAAARRDPARATMPRPTSWPRSARWAPSSSTRSSRNTSSSWRSTTARARRDAGRGDRRRARARAVLQADDPVLSQRGRLRDRRRRPREVLRRRRGGEGDLVRGAARHDDGAARRQRRRQDDDAVDAARAADAERRARHGARRRHAGGSATACCRG